MLPYKRLVSLNATKNNDTSPICVCVIWDRNRGGEIRVSSFYIILLFASPVSIAVLMQHIFMQVFYRLLSAGSHSPRVLNFKTMAHFVDPYFSIIKC